jgi:hypothetical protein
MNKQRIYIVMDRTLTERSGRISSKTWSAVKAKRGDTAFFPEGNQIIVGNNPFDPSYVLFVVDEEMPDDQFLVSEDVKRLFFPSTEFLEL